MHLEDFKQRVLPVKHKLYRFALKMMSNKQEAEDVVQDVLVKIWDRRNEMNTYLNMEAWCMRLVKNQSLDRLKSSQYKTTSLKINHDIQTDDKSPHQAAELVDSIRKIRLFIDSLPDKQKQIIHLRDIEGLSYEEIAEVLEITLAQVKTYLCRARKTIKSKLLNVEAYGTR